MIYYNEVIFLGSPKITNQEWTEEELAILALLYPKNVPIEKIAEVLLSRTVEAISNKVTRLKLKRPSPEIDKDLLKKYTTMYEC